MNKIVILVGWIMLLVAIPTEAQEPEWLFQVPKYYRLKGGSGGLNYDRTRSTILFDGGAYDSYATSDGGVTWRTVFDPKMFFIDVLSQWTIDQLGRWYYYGRYYNYNPVNLVSEDGGQSLQYLVKDTADIQLTRYGGRFEAIPNFISPGVIIFDVRSDKHPFYGPNYSTDAGYTWTHYKDVPSQRAVMYLQKTRAGKFGIVDVSAKTIEVDAYTGEKTLTDLDSRSRWVQLDNGIVVQTLGYAIGIRSPGESKFSYTTKYNIPGDTTTYRMSASYTALINDSLALVIGRAGEVWTVSRDAQLRPCMLPKHYSPYQQVVAAGMFGDLVITETYIPEGNAAEGLIYTVINTKTGNVIVHRRPAGMVHARFWGNLDRFQILPYSDSVWYRSTQQGELLQTANAGRTWKHVSSIIPDSQWGKLFVGIQRLFPRPDGSMALLTNEQRLMLYTQSPKSWDIVCLAPFVHKQEISSNSIDPITDASLSFSDDPSGLNRPRYGPSSVYFQSSDTVWVTGDVVSRYTMNGDFIDTVLPRRSRYIKRISPEILVSAMDSVYFSFNDGKEWVYVSKGMPTVVQGANTTTAGIGDMVVANDGAIIAGLRGARVEQDEIGTLRDSMPGGLVLSTDVGNTWRRVPNGIDTSLYVSSLYKTQSGVLLCVASEVRISPTWYAFNDTVRVKSQIGASNFKLDQVFVYRSTDNGRSWIQKFAFPDRERLSTTDSRILAMPDGRIMVLHPTYGVAISADEGASWTVGDPLNIGNPEIYDVAFTSDGYAHVGTSAGYARMRLSDIVNVQEQGNELANSAARATITRDGLLQVSADQAISALTVYSLDGQPVATIQGVSQHTTVDLSRAPNGVYMLVADINGRQYRDKVVWCR